MKNNSQNLFESASIPKAFLALTIPTVLSKVVMIVYNLVDTWFIAATNDTALVAAVSLCLPVLSTMAAIGDIWGVGGSSLISRLFGQGEREKAKEVSALCFYGALACSIITTVVMLALETPILRLLGADESTMACAVEYYRILAIGAPAVVVYIVPMHMLRTEGLSNAAMIGSLVGAVVHLILVPVLVLGWIWALREQPGQQYGGTWQHFWSICGISFAVVSWLPSLSRLFGFDGKHFPRCCPLASLLP